MPDQEPAASNLPLAARSGSREGVSSETQDCSLEYCAVSYLNHYIRNGSRFSNGLKASGDELFVKSCSAIAANYRVARDLHTKYDVGWGLKRYLPLLKILRGASEDDFADPSTSFISVVNEYRDKVSCADGARNVLSLTTKFIWLGIRGPIVVYERHAVRALKATVGSYAEFV